MRRFSYGVFKMFIMKVFLACIVGEIIWNIRFIVRWLDDSLFFPITMTELYIFGIPIILISVSIVIAAGLPLMVPVIWKWWAKKWWLSIGIITLSIIILLISILPPLQVMVYDIELPGDVGCSHPVLSLIGCFGILFGITWMPPQSVRNTIGLMKRWLKG